jgi:hypothetical protein
MVEAVETLDEWVRAGGVIPKDWSQAPESPSVPLLPVIYQNGDDFMEQLEDGYVVPAWGLSGWDLGNHPLVIVCHYDKPGAYGLAVYTEGDVEVKDFLNREERDRATDEVAVSLWSQRDLPDAPKTMADPRLGPYRRSWK